MFESIDGQVVGMLILVFLTVAGYIKYLKKSE